MFMASLHRDIIVITFLPKALLHRARMESLGFNQAARVYGSANIFCLTNILVIARCDLSAFFGRYEKNALLAFDVASYFISLVFIARSVFVQRLRFRLSIDAVENIDATNSVRISCSRFSIY
jgi:hypothetical protein